MSERQRETMAGVRECTSWGEWQGEGGGGGKEKTLIHVNVYDLDRKEQIKKRGRGVKKYEQVGHSEGKKPL